MPDGTIPFVTFTGVTVNAPPLQEVPVMLFMKGAGLTVIANVAAAPLPHELFPVTDNVPDVAFDAKLSVTDSVDPLIVTFVPV